MTTVLVLAGGPDAERAVSLDSAQAVATALRESDMFHVEHRVIERLTAAKLAAMPGEVIFPVLHGLWGEGGPLQDLLEADKRPYVGSGPGAARLAMDKPASKLVAASLGITTPPCGILGPVADHPSIGLPAVLKPTHEGSSVGLHLCHDEAAWARHAAIARADAKATGRAYLVERLLVGRELTVPLLGSPNDDSGGLVALPVVEITPAEGVYDYAAKYERGDTRYTVEPDLADGLTAQLHREAVRLAASIGVRDLARVDFILPMHGPDAGVPQVLEVNTMPGFTASSLLPKAAAHVGVSFAELCAQLVGLAQQRGRG